MDKQKLKQSIIALESPYDKAIRLKYKLTKAKSHSIPIKRAVTLHLNPYDLVTRYPRSFVIENDYIRFNNHVVDTSYMIRV